MIEEIQIPESLGQIEARFLSDEASPTILHIRDAHGQLEAQRNIEAILKHLKETYGFKTLFLEGGLEGEISPHLLRFFKEEEVNQRIAEKLLEEGEVTGPGVFILKENGKVQAYGIENLRLYRASLSQFRKVYRDKKLADSFLESLESKLDALGSRLLNPNLRKFLKGWLFYLDSRKDLLAHLHTLDRQAKETLELDLHDAKNQIEYPQLLRLFKLKDLEKEIQRPDWETKQNEEKERLLEWLAQRSINSYPFSSRSPGLNPGYSFLEGFDLLFQDRIQDPRAFLEEFYERAESEGFRFKDYPNLTLGFAQTLLKRELDAERLFQEIEKLTDSILQALIQTREEKEFVQLLKDLLLLRKLLSLELSRDEWNQVKEKKSKLLPSSLLKRRKGNLSPFSLAALQELDRIFREALRFYHLTQRREALLFRNFLQTLKKKKLDKALLLTGGFHTDAFEEIFRTNNLSYLIVSPKIAVFNSTASYLEKILLKQVSASSLTPALLDKDLLSLCKTTGETSFPRGPERDARINKIVFSGGKKCQ